MGPDAAPTVALGGDLTVGRVGYGAMKLTGPQVWGEYPDRDAAVDPLRSAVEAGVTFIDTADVSHTPATRPIRGVTMSALQYSVYVAPSKPAVSDDLPPGEARRMWSPTAATLVHGTRDAVLVDPLMTVDESRALADWVAATGTNLTAVVVTHAHGDHFFGAPGIQERFPGARVVATPGVAEHMAAQYGPRWFDGFWDARFPGQISPLRVVAETLEEGVLELEGEELRLIELGHTDTDGSSAVHVPSIGLLVAGDVVYGDVHLYLAESQGGGRDRWLEALDTLEQLAPTAVVAGHKRDGDPDSPEDIARTRRYLRQFDEALRDASGYEDLYRAMVALYPDRLNRGVLWNSAKAVMA